ncbi:MAG: hypothetical protein JJE10_04475 [Thermoleophilia bacterium]|nr:hypothetical protein [Thermoleophilia bacterium]
MEHLNPAGGRTRKAAPTGFTIGGVRTTDATNTTFDFKEAAAYLEKKSGDGDVVVDAASLTPAPTTSLSLYLPASRRRYDAGVSPDTPDFIESIFSKPDPQLEVSRAFRNRGPVHIVTLIEPKWVTDRQFFLRSDTGTPLTVPPGRHVSSQKSFPGVRDVVVTTFERDRVRAGKAGR